MATLTQLRLFCWWTAPIIAESIAAIIHLDKYPTKDAYQSNIVETDQIVESATPIISRLQAIESAINKEDGPSSNLTALKSEANNLSGEMQEYIKKIYGVRHKILADFVEYESPSSGQTNMLKVTEDDLICDLNSPLAILINLPRQEAQALATLRIFAAQDQEISIADILTGCAFLPFNIATSPNLGDETKESEVPSISPELAASALNAAFLSVREVQGQLFNYCLQDSLFKWQESDGPDLSFDVIDAISTENFDRVNFDEDKIRALRAISMHSSPIRVYEDAGTIVVSFLAPEDIEQFIEETGLTINLVLDRMASELRSLKINPVAITRKCGEMLEVGLSLHLPGSGKLKPYSKETSCIIDLHSNKEFVSNITQGFDHLSLHVKLANRKLLEIELPREFFESQENGFKKNKMLRSAVALCQELEGRTLLRIERLPSSKPDFDELESNNKGDDWDSDKAPHGDSDPGEITIFNDNFSLGDESSETAVSRLARLHKTDRWSSIESSKNSHSEHNHPAFRAPASWLTNSEFCSAVIRLCGLVEIARLDLIASRDSLFNEDGVQPATKVISDLAGLIDNHRDRLKEYDRPLLFMPVQAGLLAQDGSARFYLSTRDGELIGIGGVPIEHSSISSLSIFTSHTALLFKGLVSDITQSLIDSKKIPGPLMSKVQSLLINRGWALSESILSEVLSEYEETLSPLALSRVASIIYTSISGTPEGGLVIQENHQLTGYSKTFKLSILTPADIPVWSGLD
jgi:hypothetical protein